LNHYVSRKKYFIYLLIGAAAMLCVFLLTPEHGTALDFQGRIDTRYQLQAGDNDSDHDIYQYHYLGLYFSEKIDFQWYGGARKDINGKRNTVPVNVDDEERTDIAFRGLPDAANDDQTLEYRIYSAYLRYKTEKYGGLIGRYNPYEYDFSQFDGIMLWAQPLDWLRVEGFGGKPWHYNYIGNFEYYWGEGELILGAGTDFLFPDRGLNVSLRYLFLKELTQTNTLLGEPQDDFLSSDHITKARINYYYSHWLRTGFKTSFLDTEPRNIDVWFTGDIEKYLLNYYFEYYMQLIDISDIGDSLTQFSSVLTASHPYLRATANLSKSFADLLNWTGTGNDVLLELGYEHRRPTDSDDESQFNPQYNQFHIGSILAVDNSWFFQVFYEFILTSGVENDIHFVGGEIAKKWKKMKLQLGSSYYANKFETNYTQTVIEDKFFAQEYYLKYKWKPLKPIDVSFKTSFEIAKLSSLTSTDKINDQVTSGEMAEIIDDPRRYFTFDLRFGYKF
jgi:hypothetical protein